MNYEDMSALLEIVNYCNERTRSKDIKDFPGSFNGLQIENNGTVNKIGAAVDAGHIPFQLATDRGIDFLLVHHGIFWDPPTPLTGSNYRKVKHCMDHNLAVFGSHLPLDCHPELGNNAIIADKLGLSKVDTFLPYENQDIGLITDCSYSRDHLKSLLEKLFSYGIKSMEFGSQNPERIAILSGSGQSAVEHLTSLGVDTLITGELKQNHFNYAQENKLNLFTCGHYATETFGITALGAEVAKKFDLSFEFISTDCPL